MEKTIHSEQRPQKQQQKREHTHKTKRNETNMNGIVLYDSHPVSAHTTVSEICCKHM